MKIPRLHLPARVALSLWLALLSFSMISTSSPSALALARLEPASGCLSGILLGDTDSAAGVSARLGLTPAVFVKFFGFPMTPGTQGSIGAFLQEVRASGGIAMLTMEPFGSDTGSGFTGLNAVTPQSCIDLANLCASHEAQGIAGIMVRFGHEMNGNWYPWGQKPSLYRQKFQLLAQEVHARTSRTAMVWAPNNGIGYPYGTGVYSPAPGSADFLSLDTNHNGFLSEADDMFDPFYPGDAAVDWVGLTIYHWGVTYPWLENEPPFPSEFASTMNAANSSGTTAFARWFYSRYCSDGVHNKPLAIAETAAFYNTEQPGANELAMKQAWFRQLYNISGASADGPDVAVTFPKMKCINWFDHYKRESEAQSQFIDWRVSANPLVRNAFVSALRTLRNGQPYFLTAQEFACQQSANCMTAADIPAILPLDGNVTATVNVKAQTACDLVVDLLDQNFAYQGGTRVPVVAGSSTVAATFALNQRLMDGAVYRWSIFLVPTGGVFPNTIARYIGPDPIARAITPVVAIESAPPSVPPGTAFNVRVRYTAAADSSVQLTLINGLAIIRGSGSANVRRGDGLLDIALTQQPGNAAGTHALRCELATPLMPPQSVVAQSVERPIQIVGSVTANAVTLTAGREVVPVGEVFRFSVGYATASARDVLLEFSNASAVVVASGVQPVAAGGGSIDMTFVYPLASPGAYTARVHIVPAGGTAAQAVASSDPQTVHVVSHDYWLWALGNWGVIFGSDPIAPPRDADGDGALNQNEYVALTDPRDSASLLRVSVAKSGNQLTVNWPTVAGRIYQLFTRSTLSSGSWIPANSSQPGSGISMQYQTDLSSAGVQRFYRLQVSLP